MFIRTCLLATIAILTAGCMSSGTKVTSDQLAQFKVGSTTESQVMASLGQPNNVSTLQDGTRIDTYAHTAAHANGASYVPIVGLFAGGASGTTDSVVFTYDAQGVLRSTSSNRSQTNVNTGLANQH